MSSPPLPDPDALSTDELKRLVARLLARVAALEEENRRLREENARLKDLPRRPKLAPGGMDRATQPGGGAGRGAGAGRAGGSAPDRPRRQAHAAGHRGARPHGGGAPGLAAQGLPALHGPGPRARAAGRPLPAGAVGDAG